MKAATCERVRRNRASRAAILRALGLARTAARSQVLSAVEDLMDATEPLERVFRLRVVSWIP